MATRATAQPLPDYVTAEIDRTTWLDFASVLLILVGTFNVIDGVAALSNSKYTVSHLLFSNLHAWGVFFLVWGVFQILAGWAVYKGKTWGYITALVTAFVNAIAQLASVDSAPIWSVIILVIDVLVLYGLIVHNPRRAARAG